MFSSVKTVTWPGGVEEANGSLLCVLLLIQKLMALAPAKGWKPDL
jgi:hypothetical protein